MEGGVIILNLRWFILIKLVGVVNDSQHNTNSTMLKLV